MSKIVAVPVANRREKNAFLEFPWQLYGNDPHWVPLLRMEQKELVGYSYHPFYLRNRMMCVAMLLLRAMTPAAQRLGIREVEYSWVAESNSLSRGSLEKAGAKRVKTYRLYDLDMSPRECRSTVITSSSAGRDDGSSEVPSRLR